MAKEKPLTTAELTKQIRKTFRDMMASASFYDKVQIINGIGPMKRAQDRRHGN